MSGHQATATTEIYTLSLHDALPIFALLDHKAMAARALELFGELRSETRPDDLVKQMSGGQRQAVAIARTRLRSEEHTSELQSRRDLVCRLLLEKKKTKVLLPG